MNDRFFSDRIQYQTVLLNLENNNGQLKCAICGKTLVSKAECHFDHILSYAKGGRSTPDNCQILCADCNLAKSDKEVHDFILEEKARRFMSGESIDSELTHSPQHEPVINDRMTKETFDAIVGEFVKKHGNIRRIDFIRDKNGLPSIAYVAKYYGSMTEMKAAFGLKPDPVWNRESIWERLTEYANVNPGFRQIDLTKENGLPSLPCILSYYPEYRNFNDVRTALGLDLNYELWSKKKVIDACKRFLKTHDKITLKDLRKENGLPTSRVMYGYFGTMQDFQREIGSEVSKKQEFISKEALLETAKEMICSKGPTFADRASFFAVFPHSQSVILDRFGSFDAFADAAGITMLHTKKAKYAKQEVDDMILSYLKNGNPIPSSAKQLSALQLPSSATILRFYDDWKEPFAVFSKMISMTSK